MRKSAFTLPVEEIEKDANKKNQIVRKTSLRSLPLRQDPEALSLPHQNLRAINPWPHTKIPNSTPGFERLAQTGVIYVMTRAATLGWHYESSDWCNFGQGAPEVGLITGALPRPTSLSWDDNANEYSPVNGLIDLRKSIANLYNARYRMGFESKYTFENVCVTPGGRSSLVRIAACVGNVYLGHFLPDYSAYEEMLSVFKKFVPIPEILDETFGYSINTDSLRKEILNKGLSVILISNPSNPTGRVIEGLELEKWVELARETHTSLIFDEFYSSYIYTHDPSLNGRTVSAAAYVDDVNADPIIIVDGLTKNWRLPGWRISWAVGPKDVILNLSSAGSFLEGGANRPLQKAALPLLDPEFALRDTIALQNHFRAKRDYTVAQLSELGIGIEYAPCGTFYIWANLEALPPPLNNGLSFFEEALKFKIIVVPGIFFDVNPVKRRNLFHSPYHHYVRISFGPPMEELERGIEYLKEMFKVNSLKMNLQNEHKPLHHI